MIKKKTITKSFLALPILFIGQADVTAAPPGGGTTPVIKQIQVDKTNQRIAVQGSGLSGATFKVGSVAVPATNVSDTLQYLPFGAELASAVTREGSYSLVVNNTKKSAFYAEAQILVPPPPPSGGTSCPCINGWQDSGIPMDNWTWCVPIIDGTQVSLSGSRDQFYITTAFDPNHIDASNSFCALNDGTSWRVYQAIGNWDQYNDCENWMWQYICI